MPKPRHFSAFTLIEVMVAVAVIGILASVVTFTATSIQKSSRDSTRNAKVQVISDALEKYYRKNGEYPSVALMTGTNVSTLKQKLNVASTDAFKLPNSTTDNSIVTTGPSPTKLVYAANTTDTTKNTQCQTDTNGYCDGFSLQYVKEAGGGTETVTSLHATFEAIRAGDACDSGDTQNGTTCTHTYAATYQDGAYTCPSGGNLSGTTCTNTYAASYNSGGTYWYCPNGGTISGFNCVTTSSYAASYQTPNVPTCPVGNLSGNTCLTDRTYTTAYVCPHQNDGASGGSTCLHYRTSYTTSATCMAAGFYWSTYCFNYHTADETGVYSCSSGWSMMGSYCSKPATMTGGGYYCPSGGTLNGSTCTTSSSYAASSGSYSPYYYCSGSGTLSGSTCTHTYTGTQGAGYYTCPNGGTASGSTCSYTYELEG